MRRLPAPVLPPPGPPKPPNAPPNPSDSPKFGDDKFPTGVPRFTRLRMFWKLIDTFRLYLFSLGAAAPPPCGPGPPGPTRCGAAAATGPAAAGLAAAALPLLIFPKANVRLIRRLATNEPGACPKLRGTIVSPGNGVRLKLPKRVHLIFGAEQSAFGPAKLGRSLT